MAEKIEFGTRDFADNPVPRAPCVLVLDTSASMRGKPIDELNAAMVYHRNHLLANVMAANRADIAVITFGPVRTVHDFVPAGLFNPPTFIAEGDAPMADAISRAIDMAAAQRQSYRKKGLQYYRAGIFLITVGAPDGEWQEIANRLKPGESARDFTFFAVGVEDANMEMLASMTNRPPVNLKELEFTEFFV